MLIARYFPALAHISCLAEFLKRHIMLERARGSTYELAYTRGNGVQNKKKQYTHTRRQAKHHTHTRASSIFQTSISALKSGYRISRAIAIVPYRRGDKKKKRRSEKTGEKSGTAHASGALWLCYIHPLNIERGRVNKSHTSVYTLGREKVYIAHVNFTRVRVFVNFIRIFLDGENVYLFYSSKALFYFCEGRSLVRWYYI